MPAVLRKQLTKELVLDPVARLKQLAEYGSSVEVDKAVPVKRYFRSGAEMERQVRRLGCTFVCVLTCLRPQLRSFK